MNIYFYPKKSKRAYTTLYVKIIIDNEVVEMSTGLRVKPLNWDQDNDMMEFTHNIRRRLLQVHNALTKENALITSQRVKEAYLSKFIDVRTVLRELELMTERIKTEVAIGNRSKALVQKPNVFMKHLKGFLSTKGVKDITFDEVTVEFLRDLEIYIKQHGCSHNTTKKHIDIIRKLFRYAKANKWTDADPFYFYKISTKRVKRDPLDEHELTALLRKEMVGRLKSIRDIFIVQCFTGMAYSDIKRFDKTMTYKDDEGTVWIDSSRVKTGVDFDVPLLPQIAELLGSYHYKLPVPSNQKMNGYLKEIGDIVGLAKTLTTHLARRTFASVMTAKGVNIVAIQKMLGHTRITTTQDYISTDRRFLKDEMWKVLSGMRDMFEGRL